MHITELQDYQRIVSNFGHESSVKSSLIKEILQVEFGVDIGFHPRPQRNMSEIVYDRTSAGSYVDAAMSSLGISTEQLARNYATRSRSEVLKDEAMTWPPYVHGVIEEERHNK